MLGMLQTTQLAVMKVVLGSKSCTLWCLNGALHIQDRDLEYSSEVLRFNGSIELRGGKSPFTHL